MQSELKVRKILGRTYLNENRLAEALEIFSKILLDYPDDLETLLILGNCYLASGDGKTARKIYLHAQKLDPENKNIQRQISMADEIEDSGAEELAPTDLAAVARLLQRLTGKTKTIDENDIVRAAVLLDKIINSDSPAELVSRHLDEIDELMPALLELNIRQAYADGKPDLAQALKALQLNIDHQLVSKEDDELLSQDNTDAVALKFKGNILLLYADMEEKSNRMTLLKPALESYGCLVTEKGEYIPGRDPVPDVVITSNPHTNPRLLESLSALSAADISVILDLDTDFEKQPISHRDYSTKGLGTHTRGSAYTSMMLLADMITVPSDMLATALNGVAQNISVIPDGWSRQNELWQKSAPPRSTINIGWVDSSGQLEDLALIRRYIIRIIREFPNTRIVIIGNPQAYRLFENLPEHRRMYLPLVASEEFPYLLSQIDILMVPLRNTPYNISFPDTILVEAGAKGIPWIASPIPSFRRWVAGGIISESLDEWHLNLRHLVMDRDLRNNLAKAGQSAAKTREMSQLGRLWLDLVTQVTHKGISFPRTQEN
ncbi:MAG: tetratricopeptide repeat protein [Chloroflexi bacterium]|nr:tetratricopeptide repeat protein [Chloroflexota bacterium]